MTKPSSEEKQGEEAANPREGWLTRAQVAAELGYRSIFPIRNKMEGAKLHPVREARGWVFDPLEVAGLKATRTAPGSAGSSRSYGLSSFRPAQAVARTNQIRELESGYFGGSDIHHGSTSGAKYCCPHW